MHSMESFENPLKEAISNQKVPKSDLYYIRKPHKVPPSYMKSLRDLDDAKADLDRTQLLIKNRKKWDQEHNLTLKFNQQVEAERSPISYFKNHTDSVWKEPDLLQKERKSNQEYHISLKQKEELVDYGLHKSSWLRDVLNIVKL